MRPATALTSSRTRPSTVSDSLSVRRVLDWNQVGASSHCGVARSAVHRDTSRDFHDSGLTEATLRPQGDSPGTGWRPRSLERFEHEVRATARLSDPNTVEVYDYGRTEDGTFFYVMEYLHGLNLDELVGRHGPLAPGQVICL